MYQLKIFLNYAAINKSLKLQRGSQKTHQRLLMWYWDIAYNTPDPDTAWNILQQILPESINRHAPLINKRVKGKPAPWLNADVKAAMNHREKLHRKFLKPKSNTDWNMYKTAQNHATNLIRRAQKTHYKSVLRDSEKNPTKFWKMMKTIFSNQNQRATCPIIQHRSQVHNQQKIHC